MRVLAVNGTKCAPTRAARAREARTAPSRARRWTVPPGSRRQATRAGRRRRARRARRPAREERRGLAVAERDRAGLVEQEHVHVAGGFDSPARHRQDVVLQHAVHPGDADRGKQCADGGRDQADEERDQHRHADVAARVERERPQGHRREEKNDRQPGQQDVECDLVRRLLPLRSFDETDHPVEERLPGVGRDLDDDAVRQDHRAAGDRGTVAAGFADDRRRLAGDRRLVDGGDALDDVPSPGMIWFASTTTRSPFRSGDAGTGLAFLRDGFQSVPRGARAL